MPLSLFDNHVAMLLHKAVHHAECR
jgi:hypothetical protein